MKNDNTPHELHADDKNNENHSATYCPEDNKIRLYFDGGDDGRCERSTYLWLTKTHKWKFTAKQDCSAVATWSTTNEDIARQIIHESDDIGDEDTSPQERAANRAERFAGYREKRRGEAHEHATTYEDGPDAFGNQNARKAERAATRHERHKTRSLSQWDKAEYWQTRTAGVISHALHKSAPSVRRGRILTIEKEQRKHEANRAERLKRWQLWEKIRDESDAEKQTRHAKAMAGTSRGWQEYPHPDNPEHTETLYGLLSPSEYQIEKHGLRPITGAEAARLYFDTITHPNEDERATRWSNHFKQRLAYENQMIGEEGGKASEVEMIPGGWIRAGRRGTCHDILTDAKGYAQIQKVNRSPATKRVTSVSCFGFKFYERERSTKEPYLITVNIERAGENAYRAPTDEELAAFNKEKTAKKAKAKATKSTAPKLINPNKEDAEKLQAILNAIAEEKHNQADYSGDFKPAEIAEMTQRQYSDRSKGSYALAETRTLHQSGEYLARKSTNMWTSHGQAYDAALGEPICKLRIWNASGIDSWYTPARIVVITDKPQKPLPFDQFTTTQEETSENEPVTQQAPEAAAEGGATAHEAQPGQLF